MISQEKTMLNC